MVTEVLRGDAAATPWPLGLPEGSEQPTWELLNTVISSLALFTSSPGPSPSEVPADRLSESHAQKELLRHSSSPTSQWEDTSGQRGEFQFILHEMATLL